MKPQCETAADCLRELARVMEQFGITDMLSAVKSKFVKFQAGPWITDYTPEFLLPSNWQFAIAEVEGKPVFIGDELWHKGYGFITVEAGYEYLWNLYSWSQPKPKTVMVELNVEDAEKMSLNASERLAGTYAYDRVGLACKKALEELK